MLYELIAVVRAGDLNHVKEIARSTGRHILQSKGIIRGITNWGPFLLPKPIKKHQNLNHKGHYFIIRFDSSPAVQDQITYTLRRNPHMIRHSIVKLGYQLHNKYGPRNRKGSLENIPGEVEWGKPDFDKTMELFTNLPFQRGGN